MTIAKPFPLFMDGAHVQSHGGVVGSCLAAQSPATAIHRMSLCLYRPPARRRRKNESDTAVSVMDLTGVECPKCGDEARVALTQYGRRDTCHRCDMWSWHGKPLVARVTHEARKRAHRVFDLLWKRWGLPRQRMYRRLENELGLKKNQAHMATMPQEHLHQVPEAAQRIYEQWPTEVHEARARARTAFNSLLDLHRWDRGEAASLLRDAVRQPTGTLQWGRWGVDTLNAVTLAVHQAVSGEWAEGAVGVAA